MNRQNNTRRPKSWNTETVIRWSGLTYIIFHFNQIGGFWNKKFIIVFIVSPSNLYMVQFVFVPGMFVWQACLQQCCVKHHKPANQPTNWSIILIKNGCRIQMFKIFHTINMKWTGKTIQEDQNLGTTSPRTLTKLVYNG
jgi:hypothetical protein